MAQIIYIDEKRCLDPGELKISADRNQTPLDFWARANSYTCPLGPDPGSAWAILSRLDANTLARDSFHSMRFEDGLTNETISSLGIVRQFTMNRALAGDEKAAVLIELQDKRRQLRMSDINKQYNVRIPAPSVTSGTSLYYSESRNGGALWTWQTMLNDMWAVLPSIAGMAPTLPFSPDATPEGFRFIGVNAWDALHIVLTKLQVTTRWDPFDDVFSYIRLGVAQTLNLSDFAERLVYDYDPGQGYDLSKMPATVRVYFGRRELYQGIEKDTPQAGNWEMVPFTSIDVATGVAGALTGTVQQVWDDLAATIDGVGAVDNASALNARANEVTVGIVAKLNVSHERNRKLYEGIIAFLPGSQVTEVVWRNYGDGNGLFTELIQSPRSAAIEGSGVATVASGDGLSAVGEHLEGPDLSRNQYPLWPRLEQPVIVDDGVTSTGDDVAANGDGLIPGFVRRYVTVWSTLDACWIRPIDLVGGVSPSEATVVPLRQRDTVLGRLSGSITSGGTTLPLYLVRKGVEAAGVSPPNILWGKCTTNWKKNRPTECDFVVINPVVNCNGDSPTGATFTIRLPRVADRDPNLIADDIIAYRITFSGELVCVSDYTSLTIGVVDMWALALGGIPRGWAAMDGAANSPGNGGSGINMNSGASDGGGRFVRGSDTAGKVGGTFEHTHNITILVDAVSFTEAISVGLRIDDHTIAELSHQHAIIEDTPSFGFEAGVGSPDTNIHLDCTLGPVAFDDLDQQACASQPPWGPLVHRFSVSGAGGDVYTEAFGDSFIDASPHIPENTTLIFIERIDNSA